MTPQGALFIAFLAIVMPLLALLFSPLIVYTSCMRSRAQRRNPVAEGVHTMPYKVIEPQGEWNRKIIFFLHGWPDDLSLFFPAAAFFSKNGFRCVCMGLPNYRVPKQFDGTPANLPPHRNYGFAFREVALIMKNTITSVLAKNEGGAPEETILIAHDWGALSSYMYLEAFPGAISRLVIFDVGLNNPKEQKANETAFTLAYMGLLNLAFLFPSWTGIGSAIPRRLAAVMRWPTRELANPPDQNQCYLYREMYRDLFWTKRETLVKLARWKPKDFPFLFLICAKSTVKFYGEPFLTKVRESHPTLGQVERIEDTHWSWFKKEERFQLVLEFLSKPK